MDHSKTSPEVGRHKKVNRKLERYDFVPFRSRVNRKQVQFRSTSRTCLVSTGDTKLVSVTTSDPSNVEVEIRLNCTSLILLIVSPF